MIGLILLTGVVTVLAVFALASIRFGVDSRAWTNDGRPMSLFGR